MTQATLFDDLDLPSLAYCLYDSAARGLFQRCEEYLAWKRTYGDRAWHSHAWTIASCNPGDRTVLCRPTALNCDTRLWDHRPPSAACDCETKVNAYQFRGACTGCDFEGPVRDDENGAVEDAHDHSWPGWRDLPIVPKYPYDPSKQQGASWLRKVNAVYPVGWIETGGPIRTRRSGIGTRSHHGGTPFGGYDICGEIVPEEET